VAISGNYAVVGAYRDSDASGNFVRKTGAAYVFERGASGWSQVAAWAPSDPVEFDHFGYSVAIDGHFAVVGALCDDDKGTNSGSAYVYELQAQGWAQVAKLTAPDVHDGYWFGCDVAISGDRILVGADEGDHNGRGAAYVFERSGSQWIETAQLMAAASSTDARFGHSVSLFGDYALIGAYNDDLAGSNSGSAFLFAYDGDVWSQVACLTASDAEANDLFGYTVSLGSGLAWVGAAWNDDLGNATGSAYVFTPEPATLSLLALGGLALLVRRRRR